jgi:hypothetical protein
MYINDDANGFRRSNDPGCDADEVDIVDVDDDDAFAAAAAADDVHGDAIIPNDDDNEDDNNYRDNSFDDYKDPDCF